MAVDTLGHLLALHVTPANFDDRAEVGKLAGAVRLATGDTVELIYVHQGYRGGRPVEAARAEWIELCMVKLDEENWASSSCRGVASSNALSPG
jgi:hypothetical protein